MLATMYVNYKYKEKRKAAVAQSKYAKIINSDIKIAYESFLHGK